MTPDILGPEISSMLTPFKRERKRKKSVEQEPVEGLTPESEAGILSRLKNNAVGGIEAVGNVLDLPGSSVRDLFGAATGKPDSNPFDQWLPWNWTTSTNRTSGRQLARHAGLAGGQDTWGNFGAGLAVEVATDPFFWLPAGKAAQGAKAVLGTKPVKAATSALAGTRAGKAVAGAANKGKLWWNQAFDSSVMGKSTERGQKLARELWEAKLRNEQDALSTTIPLARELEKAGLNTADDSKYVRDVMEGVVPWDDKTGQLALYRDRLTAAHDANKYWGARTGDYQDIIDYNPRRMGAHVKAAYGEDVIPGVHTPFGEPNVPMREREYMGFHKGTNRVDDVLKDKTLGAYIDKIAPNLTDFKKKSKAVKKVAAGIRKLYGSEIERFFQKTNDTGNLMFDIVGSKGSIGISKHALAKYGTPNANGTFTYTPANFGKRGAPITIKPKMVDRYKELARVMIDNPEVRKIGMFTNDSVVDMHEGLLATLNTEARNKTLIKALADPVNQLGQKDFVRLKVGEKPVTIQDMMKAGGLNSKVALERIAEAMNVPKTKASLKAIRNTVIDPEIAKDLLGTQQRLKLPVPVEKALNLANSFTSLFKAGVLTWPARHTRDLTSGMLRNWEQKIFSFASAKMSHNILQGKVVEGAKDIPAVQAWLASKRLPVNDENATNALRDMYASMRAGRTDIGTDIPTTPGAAVSQGTQSPASRPMPAPHIGFESPFKRRSSTIASPGAFPEKLEFDPSDPFNSPKPSQPVLSREQREHKSKFLQKIKSLQFKGYLDKDESDFLQMAFENSDAIKTPSDISLNNKLVNEAGVATPQWTNLDNGNIVRHPAKVELNPNVNKEAGRAMVVLHELGHIARFSMPIDERNASEAILQNFFRSGEAAEYFKSVLGDKKAKNGILFRDYFQENTDEAFAQLFADYVAGRFTPKDTAATGVLEKIWKKFVEVVQRVFQVDRSSKTMKQISSMMEFAGGFSKSDDMFRGLAAIDSDEVIKGASSPLTKDAASRFFNSDSYRKSFAISGDREIASAAQNATKTGSAASVTKLRRLIESKTSIAGADSKDLATILLNGDSDFAKSFLADRIAGKPYSGMLPIPGSQLPTQVQTRKDFLSQVPGMEKALDWKQIGRKFIGKEPGTNLNPLNVRGVGGKTESTFGPVAASDQIGQYTDNMNRMTGFIELLKKGVRPEDAMKKVDDVQVSYHSRNFTPTENMFKTAFPFYSFSSRQVPYVGKELLNNPGGRLGQTIRAANSGRDDGEIAPDYVSQSASIPLGGVPLLGNAPAGTDRYLTGLGLMFEDPLSFIGGGVRGAGAEAISRTTPWIKAPIEWASGESFFQRGPLGGRDLKDMDPLMGRIGKNVAQIAKDPSLLLTGKGEAGVEPYRLPLSEPVEFAAANSPLSRLLSTTRQLTDTRKNAAVKALNALSGLRISDVDVKTKEAIQRELLQQEMREMGASEFTQTYFKEARKANLSPEKQGLANLYQQFGTKLARNARERKKAQEAEQKQKELAYR